MNRKFLSVAWKKIYDNDKLSLIIQAIGINLRKDYKIFQNILRPTIMKLKNYVRFLIIYNHSQREFKCKIKLLLHFINMLLMQKDH